MLEAVGRGLWAERSEEAHQDTCLPGAYSLVELGLGTPGQAMLNLASQKEKKKSPTLIAVSLDNIILPA